MYRTVDSNRTIKCFLLAVLCTDTVKCIPYKVQVHLITYGLGPGTLNIDLSIDLSIFRQIKGKNNTELLNNRVVYADQIHTDGETEYRLPTQ